MKRNPIVPAAVLAIAVLVATLPCPSHAQDASLYAELLQSYTRQVTDLAGTRVDYAGLRGEPKWKRLVAQLEASDPASLGSREQRLAFWINAYNILAIQTVLGGYPLESIRDLGSFFSPVWKREAGRVGGQVVSLHEVEHEILRPMKDPRIHAAIVCASTSCPSLAREPYTAAGIDVELDRAFRAFLADRGKGMRIDRANETLYLSSIFDWFEEDWQAQGGVVRAIAKQAPEADRAWLRQHAASLEVDSLDYDWRLNDTTTADRRR